MTILPQGDLKARQVRAMFDRIAPRYDLMNRILTFRMDVGWRRRAVRSLRVGPGDLVVDLACGTGDLCREIAEVGATAVGVDYSGGMLAHALVPDSVALVQADGLALPLREGAVPAAISGFALRNFSDLDAFFAELARVVRRGGRIALLEVAEPENRLLRAGHSVYFRRVVPVVGAALSDREAYRYLPESVAYLPPPDALLARLREAGFALVERELLSRGIAQLITAVRR